MGVRAPLKLACILLAAQLAGCAFPGTGDRATGTPATTTSPTSIANGPPLHFGGVVVDALGGKGIQGASVRIDLAQTRPCRIEAIAWADYQPPVDIEGRFGIIEVPRPKSDDFAFFLHAFADGYTENATYVGPNEARGDLGNLTVVLHPRANVTGHAPPATVLALDDARFPRFAVAGEDGRFAFEGARVLATQLVAGTDVPFRANVTAPEVVDVPLQTGAGWRLEGQLRTDAGAPLAGNVVARNGTMLVSAARAGDNGVFVLPMPPTGQKLTIEARTPTLDKGATRVLDVQGPPATRETWIMRALPC